MLEVQHISKTYSNGNKALNDVSFNLQKGEFVSIIGPSGAGKSTLLRTINQLLSINEGSINFQSIEVNQVKRKMLRKIRRQIGMIFQHDNLVDRLSTVENVLHGRLGYKSTICGILGIYTEKEKQMAFNLLKQVGLQSFAYTRCDQLSGGQRQRVGIARALMQKPMLILCDEPIASLDPKTAKVVMDYLKKSVKEMGIACLINLHQVHIAIEYSDRVIGINCGKILFDGSPSELNQDVLEQIYQSEDFNSYPSQL